MQRFLQIPEEQREKALSRLPPERQKQIRERLQRLEQLNPEQRQQLVRHYQAFQDLAPVRRTMVRQAITRLRREPEGRRKQMLDSTEAKLRFNPEELQLIREVLRLPESVE